jgi:membrane-associated protease RseP (regulator of RpoE activity)
VLIQTNLFIIVFNLIPIAPLDGAKAWRAVPLLRERAQQTSWAASVRKVVAAHRAAREKKLEAKAARVAGDIIERLKKGKPGPGDGAA